MTAIGTFFPYKFERRTAGFAVEPSVERTSCTLASWRISSSSELPELPELPGFHLFTVSPP
ncbi:MAG: hypothetical protein ACI9UT_002254, partial [Flavobacteriales bacterium]